MTTTYVSVKENRKCNKETKKEPKKQKLKVQKEQKVTMGWSEMFATLCFPKVWVLGDYPLLIEFSVSRIYKQ